MNKMKEYPPKKTNKDPEKVKEGEFSSLKSKKVIYGAAAEAQKEAFLKDFEKIKSASFVSLEKESKENKEEENKEKAKAESPEKKERERKDFHSTQKQYRQALEKYRQVKAEYESKGLLGKLWSSAMAENKKDLIEHYRKEVEVLAEKRRELFLEKMQEKISEKSLSEEEKSQKEKRLVKGFAKHIEKGSQNEKIKGVLASASEWYRNSFYGKLDTKSKRAISATIAGSLGAATGGLLTGAFFAGRSLLSAVAGGLVGTSLGVLSAKASAKKLEALQKSQSREKSEILKQTKLSQEDIKNLQNILQKQKHELSRAESSAIKKQIFATLAGAFLTGASVRSALTDTNVAAILDKVGLKNPESVNEMTATEKASGGEKAESQNDLFSKPEKTPVLEKQNTSSDFIAESENETFSGTKKDFSETYSVQKGDSLWSVLKENFLSQYSQQNPNLAERINSLNEAQKNNLVANIISLLKKEGFDVESLEAGETLDFQKFADILENTKIKGFNSLLERAEALSPEEISNIEHSSFDTSAEHDSLQSDPSLRGYFPEESIAENQDFYQEQNTKSPSLSEEQGQNFSQHGPAQESAQEIISETQQNSQLSAETPSQSEKSGVEIPNNVVFTPLEFEDFKRFFISKIHEGALSFSDGKKVIRAVQETIGHERAALKDISLTAPELLAVVNKSLSLNIPEESIQNFLQQNPDFNPNSENLKKLLSYYLEKNKSLSEQEFFSLLSGKEIHHSFIDAFREKTGKILDTFNTKDLEKQNSISQNPDLPETQNIPESPRENANSVENHHLPQENLSENQNQESPLSEKKLLFQQELEQEFYSLVSHLKEKVEALEKERLFEATDSGAESEKYQTLLDEIERTKQLLAGKILLNPDFAENNLVESLGLQKYISENLSLSDSLQNYIESSGGNVGFFDKETLDSLFEKEGLQIKTIIDQNKGTIAFMPPSENFLDGKPYPVLRLVREPDGTLRMSKVHINDPSMPLKVGVAEWVGKKVPATAENLKIFFNYAQNSLKAYN